MFTAPKIDRQRKNRMRGRIDETREVYARSPTLHPDLMLNKPFPRQQTIDEIRMGKQIPQEATRREDY